MAGHAGMSGRDPGEMTGLGGRVAVSAVYPEHAGMVLMTKLHWLLPDVVPVVRIISSVKCAYSSDKRYDPQKQDEQAYPGQRIGLWSEYLRHRTGGRPPSISRDTR